MRVLTYQPASLLGIDRLLRGHNRAARWTLFGKDSIRERSKVRTLVVAEMPAGTETGSEPGSAVCIVFGQKASPSRGRFAAVMDIRLGPYVHGVALLSELD